MGQDAAAERMRAGKGTGSPRWKKAGEAINRMTRAGYLSQLSITIIKHLRQLAYREKRSIQLPVLEVPSRTRQLHHSGPLVRAVGGDGRASHHLMTREQRKRKGSGPRSPL